MNVKEYIESGILEEYALGLVSPQEQQEVACLSKIYPEIKKALSDIEEALEHYAMAHAKKPPVELKTKILNSIEQIPIERIASKGPTTTKQTFIQTQQELPLWTKFSVAASLLFCIAFLATLYQISQLKSSQNEQQNKFAELTKKSDKNAVLLSLYQNPNIATIRLNGVGNTPQGSGKIFWDKTRQIATLHIENLPKPSENQQYQLWRIVDGKPVDMGLVTDNFQENLLQFSINGGASAFAITLEKRGGNPNPTLEQMVVMGGV